MSDLSARFLEDYGCHLEPGEIVVSSDSVTLKVPRSQATIHLTARLLTDLLDCRRPTIEGLTYFDHCGFHYADYAEFLIHLEGLGGWPADRPLQFKIGTVLVTVGRSSHVLPALLEPYYREEHFFLQSDFDSYTSVGLNGVTMVQARAAIHQAIFYLNVTYLAPLRSGAQIWHLATDEDLKYLPREDQGQLVPRKRVRIRKPFKAVAPLLLFNDACMATDDGQFLGFYRVLEYFFLVGFEEEVSRLRADEKVSTADLIKTARERTEVDQLRALLLGCLTGPRRRALTRFATLHKLTATPGFDGLVAAMYDFRCSLVHAKAQELHRTRLPDPLVPDSRLSKWAYIARQAALSAIRKFA